MSGGIVLRRFRICYRLSRFCYKESNQMTRVQQEQLAAIFQLLRENQETFGEVTEGDVEEQLKLYSI
ncbi:hypothetical protein SKAU_G00297010 [Synaphobranchus kaupii]|uniref:Matrix-remodeling-associated protein 7 helical domain-containing protein n=1 Tax=Synaphobranchus kaupii TaxID=118154 RepID=A0A9Q1IMW1_SYNKA|nr:hypothetical protein SKAU_G00297010 [Synaphobranchus kaupii]